MDKITNTRTSASKPYSPTAQTILVVEDEELVAELIAETLEDEGYKVIRASSGQDALSSLEHEQPDLILSDVMLPRLDGVSMCRTIQQSPTYKAVSDTPVVFMSAVVTRVEKSECKYEAFVSKPFVLDDLLGVIDRVLKHDKESDHSDSA